MTTNLEQFEGKIFTSVFQTDNKGQDEIHFLGEESYKMSHFQDCCENVDIESIVGNLTDLIDTPIVDATQTTENGENGSYDSYTWTFYNFRTIKGSVTIRWNGESNGYYSESVDVIKL